MDDCNRIPAGDRALMADLNMGWTRICALLPNEGEVSEIDAADVVREQWEICREAYSGMGLEPHYREGGNGQDIQ